MSFFIGDNIDRYINLIINQRALDHKLESQNLWGINSRYKCRLKEISSLPSATFLLQFHLLLSHLYCFHVMRTIWRRRRSTPSYVVAVRKEICTRLLLSRVKWMNEWDCSVQNVLITMKTTNEELVILSLRVFFCYCRCLSSLCEGRDFVKS